jgi:CRISPR system Cascade subunit CasC
MALVEAGAAQPRTLANAFLQPVAERPDAVANAYDALSSYVVDVDQVFGLANRRAVAAIGPKERLAALGTPGSIDDLARFAAEAVAERV